MKKIFIVVASMGFGLVAGAVDCVMTNTDAAGSSSFNTGVNWSNGLAPSTGNTYRTANKAMRTPNDTVNTPFLFAGDRLTLETGGSILWKNNGPVTVNDLVFNNGSVNHGWGGITGLLFGTITIPSGYTGTFGASNLENDNRYFSVYSTLAGSGTLYVTMGHTNALKQTYLFADNSGFTGKFVFRGLGKVGICNENALGGNPAAFMANQVSFDGMTLLATNSFAIDDANRGITLSNSLNVGSQIYPGGVFEVTGTNTLSVACLITGPGPLTKRGSGTLVLATNNTYTGLTTVENGTLRLSQAVLPGTAAMSVTGSTATVSGSCALSNVTLSAGGQLLAQNGGFDITSLSSQGGVLGIDLSTANPNTVMFRVSGALSKPAFTAFVISAVTNNLIETPYKVLTASNLSSFKDIDFCVSPPWIGELAFADDGLGGKVLTFTPTPADKINFKTANDLYGTTGFTTNTWSDGLPASAGKTYVSRSYEMRLPPNGNMTFPGKRLIYDNAMNISLKGTGTATITDLTVMNNASFSMTEPPISRLAGNIRLHPVLDAGRTYALYVNGWSNLRTLYLFANLYGYGDIILSTLGDPSTGVAMHILSGNNTNFFGRVKVQGNTNFWLRITSEEKLGGVPPAFRADQLSFNGAGLSVTNNVTLDDPTRGITLLADGGTAGTSVDPGAYTNGTPAADRRFEGGVTMRPEVGNTLTVNCPITGPGMLIKAGAGLLVLGGYNSYTGLTAITSGALRPTTTNAFGTGPVKVHAGGRLVRRYPSATMPNGVELGGAITFVAGSAVRIELEEGQTLSGNFTLPLFLLATGQTIDPSTVPIEHDFRNYKATVITSTLGSRVLVSAQLALYGTRIVIQ